MYVTVDEFIAKWEPSGCASWRMAVMRREHFTLISARRFRLGDKDPRNSLVAGQPGTAATA
jgi:hypothetical protein